MASFTFIDLFAGIGGFRLALQSAGGVCIGFSEIAKDAIDHYCINYQETKENNFGDITKLKKLPQHDFMTAGVPCQSWSIAGKNLGFDDDRGQLWNDTIYLLNQAKPKAFIFENVKGLADPRNSEALDHIMDRIRQAGYFAGKYILNAYDYGVPQTRVRIYIIGFKEEKYFNRFKLAAPHPGDVQLYDVLDGMEKADRIKNRSHNKSRWSLSCNSKGFNDYFLFNDIRNGDTTIHSWDIIDTTEKQKRICLLLLRNRRKSQYGVLDGNALSVSQFRNLDNSISARDLEELTNLGILKKIPYSYRISSNVAALTEDEKFLLSQADGDIIIVDKLKISKEFRKRKINIAQTIKSLSDKAVLQPHEERYDFKNGKISTGINGVNRIFLPSSKIFPTLVASDTNDYVSTVGIDAETATEWKSEFMKRIYHPINFRKITKSEACKIQGFPHDFILPESRARWMRLVGNSVAVPVIKMIADSIVMTGVFDESAWAGAEKCGGRHNAQYLFDF